ncbi:MAG: ribosome recycling factor [Roseiflexaceae bacterium]|nr:ribosome recycling factor [Roseiflexaceae bacterium]
MINDLLRETEAKMKKSSDALRHNLASIRTGRASPALVENLQVMAYGDRMPLNQLAQISVPDARMIVIQPYDAGTIKPIYKAIQNSELGINPTDDGRLIRLALPPLTEDRRRDLLKTVRTRVEEAKVAVRNNRRESVDEVREYEHEKLISEDDARRAQEKLQELTDRYVREVEQIGSTKEAEVMEI